MKVKKRRFTLLLLGAACIFIIVLARGLNYFFISYFFFGLAVSVVCMRRLELYQTAFVITSLIVGFISVQFGVFSNSIEGIDSQKYYGQAFGDAYSPHSITGMLGMGYIPIVQTYAEVLKFIGSAVGTENVEYIVSFNMLFCVLAAALFATTTKRYLGLSKGSEFFLFLLVLFSPMIGSNIWSLNKDIFGLFLTVIAACVFVEYLKSKIFSMLLVFLFLGAISFLIRPYNIVFIVIYVYLWGGLSSFWIKMSLFAIWVFGFMMAGIYYFKDAALVLVSVFAAPNFLRAVNWEFATFMTLESVFMSFFVLPILAFSLKDEVVKRCLVGVVLFSFVLAGVTVQRLIYDSSFSMAGLLADDVVRKKIQILPVVYVAFLVGFKRILSNRQSVGV